MHSFHDLKGITVRLILKLGIFNTVNVAYRHKLKFYPRGTQGLESEITKAWDHPLPSQSATNNPCY